MTRAHHADVVIVGSGMGGGTLAWALRDRRQGAPPRARGFLPSEPQNWSAAAVFSENRYKAKSGATPSGGWFAPACIISSVGTRRSMARRCRGCAKLTGEIQHAGVFRLAGRFPMRTWPRITIGQSACSGFTARPGPTRTDPPRSGPFPFPPMPPDPYMAELAERIRTQVCIRRRCRWV